ncbi:hypothetical protein [Pedobacter sp. UBA5917]|jgi:hypothetical protein|uniref:hypothetical protein n=1 Tax=Pedobacter sp. UBA5917 TaxID=1947061 RepID=UPI0025FB28F5|nr:hypothetical protein [Pedobacter sp. UBA5917]
MNIVIEDHNVKKSLLEANQLIWKTYSKRLKLVSLIFFILGIITYSYLHYIVKNEELDLTALIFCWVVALSAFSRLLRTKRSFWARFTNTSNLAFPTNTRKIIITDEGIEGITDNYRSFAKWNILTSFKVYDQYISITNLIMQTPFFIPINLMTAEEYKSLLYYLRANKKESR